MYIHYPSATLLISPKDFRCSHCGNVIKRKSQFVRTNHGRYCLTCHRIDNRKATVV